MVPNMMRRDASVFCVVSAQFVRCSIAIKYKLVLLEEINNCLY